MEKHQKEGEGGVKMDSARREQRPLLTSTHEDVIGPLIPINSGMEINN